MAKRGDEGAGGRAAEPVERWAEAEAMEPAVAAERGDEAAGGRVRRSTRRPQAQAQKMPSQHVRELWQMDEIVEEILFRLPPDQPENLLRASLVCKPWYQLLSDHGFRRRYREFHQQKPPMLGFLHSWSRPTEFVQSTKFLPRWPDLRHCYSVEDCRHGRVLLRYEDEYEQQFLVIWDPMTGSQTMLRQPKMSGWCNCASVLCAVDSCDHGACQLGPSLVVFISLDEEERVATTSVYSSETSNWSSPASHDIGFFESEIGLYDMPSVLAGDELCFLFSRDFDFGILKYDLGKSCLSEIHLSSAIGCPIAPILMVAEDGRLGLAYLHDFYLSVWWREVGPDEVAVWSQHRVIDLETLLPIGDPEVATELVGSVEGTGIIFAITDLGTYMIDLKLLTSKELSTELYQRGDITWALFPYLSFYSPPAGAGAVPEASSEAGHGNDEA